MTPDDLPAILGGPAVRPEGPPDWPFPDTDIRAALERAHESGAWGKYHGGQVEALEHELAAFHGIDHALACGSGTFAVELALRALKVGPGDEVLLAGYDYPGNFLTLHALGAVPVLVDLHPANWNLDPSRLEEAVTPSMKAVVVSHLHGGMVPMREVMALVRARGIKVVEDACQCPGAWVQGRRAGSWGDAGVLSFGGSKLLTAGRGGCLLTPHPDVLQRSRIAHHRGNIVCPLSELQAAVLLPQLTRLDERNALRHQRVTHLCDALLDVPGLQPFDNGGLDCQPGYYKAGFRFEPDNFGLSRERLVCAVRAEGVAIDEGFRALHVGRSPSRFRAGGVLDEAERAHHGSVILHHPVLLGTPEDVEQVARAIRKVWHHRERLR